MIYVVIAFLLIAVVLYYSFKNKLNVLKHKYQYDINQVKDDNKDLAKRLIRETIFLALTKMDETCGFYNEEDEANRELTTALNLLGHHAVYHQLLDNARTADILVDNNTLIEGKLDPQLSDVDRLMGQLDDYAKYPYNICVVIYGFVAESLLDKMRTTVGLRYPSICIINLSDPNRIRKQNVNKVMVSK